MDNKLIFFTSSYPFGRNEPFITAELSILAEHFKEIEIYPFYFNNKITHAREVPDNVSVNEPVIPLNKSRRFLLFLISFIQLVPLTYFINDFFKYKVFLSKQRIANWLLSFMDFCIMWNSKQVKRIKQYKETTFYYYWGTNWAFSLCFIKTPVNRYFLRLHGGEVYLERNHGYIPNRDKVFGKADCLITISKQLKEYLISIYKVPGMKLFVSRLGTEYLTDNPNEDSEHLQIVSVSNLVPLKRVHLIIEALSGIKDLAVTWYHFGDGPESAKLKILAKEKLGSNIEVHWMGFVDNKEIRQFYGETHIDAFINVSLYEGVPVSIMEANASSIPAIATNVGATGELVNDDVGKLLNESVTSNDLRDAILNIRSHNWQQKRMKCFQRWKEYYNAESNYLRLVQVLKRYNNIHISQ